MKDNQNLNNENEELANESLSNNVLMIEEEKDPHNYVNIKMIYQLLHLLSILLSVY